MHRLFIETLLKPADAGSLLELAGEEAAHAVLVKRVGPGDALQVLDGRGHIAEARIEPDGVFRHKRDPRLTVRLVRIALQPHVWPLIHIASAVPKGDRAAQLIDQLAQTGATSWSPLVTDHGVAEAGQHKLDRFTRIAREGAKQCGRAHALHIGPERTLAAALQHGPEPALPDTPAVDLVLIADASGQPPGAIGPMLASARAIRVLVGPEGGWSGAERAAFGASPGARMLVCGPHVMRIETAAVAAVVALRCADVRQAD